MLDAVPYSSVNSLVVLEICPFAGTINEIMLVPLLKRDISYIHYYRSQTKLREGYVFTDVCDSVQGRGMSGCQGGVRGWGVCMVAGGAWLQGGMRGWQGGGWLLGGVRRIRRYTVNERAVCILLECILVLIVLLEMVKDKKDTVNFQFKALFTLNVCVYVFL